MERVRGIHAFLVVPSYNKNYSFIVSFESTLSHLLVGATHVSLAGGLSLAQPFLSLISPENYCLILFVVDILTLIFILLVFNFFLNYFVKFLFIFNFIIQFQFVMYYFFQFSFYSFDF